MNADVALQLLLQLLPAIIVFGLAFVAAADKRSRERWADLLYQTGNLRPDQRSDPKVQNGVRIPFFIVAAALLIWPIKYYFYATRTIELSPTSDLNSNAAPSLDRINPTPTAAPVSNSVAAPGQRAPGVPPGVPAASTPAAPGLPPAATPAPAPAATATPAGPHL